ncbi:MAG: hypothetical protein KJO76_08380 [Gammaproteobacteria bacterium]|nr:hypothetical protein [Gammaproteobacteria bacterium]NND37477.1 hypothetical protein [Gammaproteobacteria bacterium]
MIKLRISPITLLVFSVVPVAGRGKNEDSPSTNAIPETTAAEFTQETGERWKIFSVVFAGKDYCSGRPVGDCPERQSRGVKT